MKRLPVVLLIALMAGSACTKKHPAAVPTPQPPPPTTTSTPRSTPSPVTTTVPPAPPSIPMDPAVTVNSDPLVTADIEKINKESPFKPVYFAYDSDTLDDLARATMSANAEIMKKYPTWVITVEGHCDERGTAEYNLALGDRRALAVKNYMMSLGIAGDRLKTVSYGSEFPFAPGHDEAAWTQNRRAHFMLTAK
jgi:peptidoglycan-associated lipoprotein